MLDTGADISTIPKRMIKKLDLRESSTMGIQNADGSITPTKSYYVNIIIDGIRFSLTRIAALGEDDILIGRDIINLWKLTLDGKNKNGEIEIWSNNLDDVYL